MERVESAGNRGVRGEGGMLERLFYGGPPIEVLHEEYAKKGRVDAEALVKASHEVLIEAPVERVWGLLSDVAGWGTWYPDVHDVRLDSGVEADARFDWRNGKARIRSRFAVVDAGREITWTGVSSGAKAVHRHMLEPTGDGATRVFSEESMAGPLLILFFDGAKLRAGMEGWMAALKTAAEGR
ncbi:MAG: SRPBCC family protein [Actinomycetota bacterium]|nr:SRPBCC family protein [Actinomycetota bacterium]